MIGISLMRLFRQKMALRICFNHVEVMTIFNRKTLKSKNLRKKQRKFKCAYCIKNHWKLYAFKTCKEYAQIVRYLGSIGAINSKAYNK